MTLIDISAGLSGSLPVWPSSRGWSVDLTSDVRRGDDVTESFLSADVHTGTHVDAPLHHLSDGFGVEGFALDAFVGPALVVDATGQREVGAEVVARLPAEARRVLFRTDNSVSKLMRQPHFEPAFVGLSVGAADALSCRDSLLLVGSDYLSVQSYGGDDEVHRLLLRKGVALLEGVDLSHVEPGWYDLFALPVLLPGAEGAPVRAVLRPLDPSHEIESRP